MIKNQLYRGQFKIGCYFFLMILIFGSVSGCSIRKMAVDEMGAALASGGDIYASDDDPELIKAATPFSLKLMESLLAENPEHRALLLAAARGFTQYSYAFVQQEADEVEDEDLSRAGALRERARRLYLRARNYGLRGLEVDHPGLSEELWKEPRRALDRVEAEDVPLLYWTAAAWASAVSLSQDDPEMVGDLPVIEALIDRALELDESFGDGSIHAFLITYEISRPDGAGDPADRARRHFDRAMELNDGGQAAPLVALAEAVSIPAQNREEFRSLLERALAIDPDNYIRWRMGNLIYQRRARWLLEREDELFLGP